SCRTDCTCFLDLPALLSWPYAFCLDVEAPIANLGGTIARSTPSMLPIPDGDPGSSACLPTLRKGRWTYLEVFSSLALAALVTVLTSLKPLHMDDGTLQTHAAHIANHPLDPYGFEILWHQRMSPAHQQLAPPVALYWWALAIRLFGDQPVLWKLWFLAFN